MPLYEFRCLKCNECFEILVMNSESDDQVEMRCPQCKSEEFERILSVSGHSMGSSSSDSPGTQSQTRTCSSGSCTTYDIPGPPK
jgi:putative FmdB family regulatory protein